MTHSGLEHLNSNTHQAFVIIKFFESEPAGLAICIEGFSSFACMPLINIHDMAVLPKFRGRKYSHNLLV